MRQNFAQRSLAVAEINRATLGKMALAESVLFVRGQMLPSHDTFSSCLKEAEVKDIEESVPVTDRHDVPWQGTCLRVFGPCRVVRSDGLDVTPGGALRQAILAVLATAPGQVRARKTLQDMFWGQETADRASANLRTAVYLLRQDLKPLGPDLVIADRHTVSLAPGRIEVLERQSGDGLFLEGIDLGMAGSEAFEDWLRERRLEPSRAEDAHPSPSPVANPAIRTETARHIALGVLPPVHPGLGPKALMLADRVLDAMVRSVTQTTSIDIHDLRLSDQSGIPLPINSGKGATHWVQALLDPAPSGISIRLRLLEGGTRRLLWMSDPFTATRFEDEHVGYLRGEAIVTCLMSETKSDNIPDLFPVTALAALFSLDPALTAATDAKLEEMAQRDGRPVIECLRLFSQVFKVHESLGPEVPVDFDGLCARLSAMSSADPLLPLCQSLLGYSMHMLSGDTEMAALLVEAADERAPALSINLDHMAVMRLVRGDLQGAEQALSRCLRTGAFSPWRYTYEVTGAMVSLAKGDVRQSLLHANQALFRQPRYLGALRYSMAGFALAGNITDARRMHSRIQTLRPSFDLSVWAEGLLRRTPAPLGKTLIAGLRHSELI